MSDGIFKISITPQAIRDLQKIDKVTADQIRKKIKDFLAQAPRELGKSLSHRYKGLYRYRYRYGNYRIIYEILEKEKMVIVHKVGHRSDIYE